MKKIALVFLLLALSRPALCAPSWMWDVLVVPPPGGWETEPGKSVGAALAWFEAEIGDSGGGVGGHDLRFVLLPNERTPALPIDGHTVAVMSFADAEVDNFLVGRMAGNGVPLLLAGGEEVLIDRAGGPLSNVFALDLYRDYRCQAFALYAAKKLPPQAYLALAASRFTVNQEREAKICYGLLEGAGFMPVSFWMDASARDSFSMMAQEIESSSDGVVLTFLGGMGTKELWRNFMRARTAWQIWNCAMPDETYLSFRGMVFADQNLFLPGYGGFLGLKQKLWATRVQRVQDLAAAGRAEALVEWLSRGIAALVPQPVEVLDRPALLRALGEVQGIPFGSQKLDISPALHRPRARQVYIVEVRDRDYALLDTLPVPGLEYDDIMM